MGRKKLDFSFQDLEKERREEYLKRVGPSVQIQKEGLILSELRSLKFGHHDKLSSRQHKTKQQRTNIR